jgi:peroxiredoxin Q/BCP
MSDRTTRASTRSATKSSLDSLKAKTESSKASKKSQAPKEQPANPTKSKVWQIGSKITNIVLKNESDEPVDLLKESQDSGIVIFFYPKANTPGCTVQGCLFRDHYSEFEALGYKVFGCSADSPKSQTTFITKQNFNYSLLSDPKHELIKAIGASSAGKITRSHVVIGKGGIFLDAKIKISPKDSAKEALEFIKSQ